MGNWYTKLHGGLWAYSIHIFFVAFLSASYEANLGREILASCFYSLMPLHTSIWIGTELSP